MLLWQLILIQIATFLLLVFLLRHFLYRQSTQSLGRLQQLYRENLTREAELDKRREETDQELKAKFAQHSEELKRLRAEAETAAQKTGEELLARAREDAKRIVAEADGKTERLKSNLVREMEEKALGLATDILQHVFTPQVARGVHHQLIDELIEEIGGSDGHRLPLNVETAEIGVRFPLTESEKANLTTMLSSKLGRPVAIKETIDQDVVAGMVVRLDNVILDGSLRTKLQGTLAYVRDRLSR
jgi:F-type H+-transporting ATPase subunit b